MRGKEVKSILPQDYDVTNEKSVFMERKCKDKTINMMLTDTAYELGAGGRERPPRTHNHHLCPEVLRQIPEKHHSG